MLTGKNGDEFSIEISGYQFPMILEDTYDSNWLYIIIDSKVNGKSWTSRDPSLLTWEVASLIQGIEKHLKGKEADSEISFIEPNLSFQISPMINGQVHLMVFFELECRPNWAQEKDEFFAELDCNESELIVFVEKLSEQLSKFPIRAGAER